MTRIYTSKNEPFNSDNQEENDKRYVVELNKTIHFETIEWKTMRDKVEVTNSFQNSKA